MSQIKETFLGTGAPDATKYYHSCFVVHDSDTRLLVDAGGGNGILVQLEKAGMPLESIRHLFVTHKHIDHIFGVFWILRFLGAKIAKDRAEDLTLYASDKVIKVIRDISPLFLKEKVTSLFDEKILFHPIDDQKEFSIGTWRMQPINLRSEKEEQFGFRLRADDGTDITCLGDEPYKDALLEYCEHTGCLIHNAYCLERDSERFNPHGMHHSSVRDACEAAIATKAGSLILYHTEDVSTFGNRKQEYMNEAKIYFDGKTLVPDDLETVIF